MREILGQVVGNLRANKLRSFLTMFGILWGVISVVILSATGEGFQRGNQHVLEELGKNVGIVWGGRTSAQAGGERAGRAIFLTVDDARAIEAESSLVAVVSPEIQRGAINVKSAYNAAALQVHGIEPQYQQIRTIDIERGRGFRFSDNDQALRVAIIGADSTKQLFGDRDSIGATVELNGLPYTVIGKIRHKDQDSSYSGPDNDMVFVPLTAMMRDFPRTDADPSVVSQIIVSPKQWVVDELPGVLDRRTGRIEDIDWPLERDIRRVLAPRHRFDPTDRNAIAMWDTTLQTLMFGRMIQKMKDFFGVVGMVTLALGGLGVMNIMLVAVQERTREIGVRKALGATTKQIQRQFFLEGFLLTMLSGTIGLAIALGLCAVVNQLPMPARFQGMTMTWQSGVGAIAALVLVGVATSTYPARRAALLPPVEALRYEG
ncbi:MAG TPA: ABC transporter permease [Vicinamibacterales bacterium]|jgi:putative ABC transport system permease protein|nr:ABC transporter permease [Vicinamibacterales bacterium]